MTMTKITREHLAGLELFAKLHGIDLDYMLREDLVGLIAQASAAPEPGEVARVTDLPGHDFKSLHFNIDLQSLALGTKLYTHVNPSEVERLRAELVESDKCVVRALNERNAAQQQLAEAQALLRDGLELMGLPLGKQTDEHARKVEAFLSATAQPAEASNQFDRDGYVAAMREVAKEFARADGTAGKVSKWALGRIAFVSSQPAEVKS